MNHPIGLAFLSDEHKWIMIVRLDWAAEDALSPKSDILVSILHYTQQNTSMLLVTEHAHKLSGQMELIW
jgi:hypothetical protein